MLLSEDELYVFVSDITIEYLDTIFNDEEYINSFNTIDLVRSSLKFFEYNINRYYRYLVNISYPVHLYHSPITGLFKSTECVYIHKDITEIELNEDIQFLLKQNFWKNYSIFRCLDRLFTNGHATTTINLINTYDEFFNKKILYFTYDLFIHNHGNGEND